MEGLATWANNSLRIDGPSENDFRRFRNRRNDLSAKSNPQSAKATRPSVSDERKADRRYLLQLVA